MESEKFGEQQSVKPSAPEKIGDWKIEISLGKGALGDRTARATAHKEGTTISADVPSPEAALVMIEDMIRKRNDPQH